MLGVSRCVPELTYQPAAADRDVDGMQGVSIHGSRGLLFTGSTMLDLDLGTNDFEKRDGRMFKILFLHAKRREMKYEQIHS